MIHHHITDLMQEMLVHARRRLDSRRLDMPPAEQARLQAYAQWAEDALCTFSTDLDTLSPEKISGPLPPPIHWQGCDGNVYAFRPSHAITALNIEAFFAGFAPARHMEILKWALLYGRQFDEALSCFQIDP